MATLTNPVNAQNILDRFTDYVVTTANADIIWGNANPPTYAVGTGYQTQVLPTSTFGGTTSGSPIAVSAPAVGTVITANVIYGGLVGETNRYTRMRKLRAVLTVTGGGGNTGSKPTAGVVFDQTQKSNLSADFGLAITIGTATTLGIISGAVVSSSVLETFFTNLRTGYEGSRDNVFRGDGSVCHASCHSSCHESRWRR
jgi:hypothetical protein